MNRGNTERLVWDLPTRAFHWSLALTFTVAYLTGENDHYALLHVSCGFTVLGLIIFRIIWGFMGSRYARFKNFLAKISEIFNYLKSLLTRSPAHYVGHNPAGGLAICLLLILGLTTAITGWVEYEDLDISHIELVHELSADTMLVLVLIHVSAVFLSSFLHRENLIRAMLTGCKSCSESECIHKSHPVIALSILACIASFWLWMYRSKWLPLLGIVGT